MIRRVRAEFPLDQIDWTGPELPRLWNEVLNAMEMMDGRMSFHDCLLLAVARDGNIRSVASFDRAFDRAEGAVRIGSPATLDG